MEKNRKKGVRGEEQNYKSSQQFCLRHFMFVLTEQVYTLFRYKFQLPVTFVAFPARQTRGVA